MGFLRTVLILVLIYYALKWIAKFAIPLLLNHLLGKYGYNSQRWQEQNNQGTTKEGEVHLKSTETTKKKKKFSGGEYVDFEEIKD